MAWTLDRFTVNIKPILPELTDARLGATHVLSLRLDASGPSGTLSSSIPLAVRIGESIEAPLNGTFGSTLIYGWNGDCVHPTISPDVRIDARGGLHASLVDGVLTPLSENREVLLTQPVTVTPHV